MKYKHYLGYKKYKTTRNSFITYAHPAPGIFFEFNYRGSYHRSGYIDGLITVYRLEPNGWRFKYKSNYTKPSTIGLIIAALDYIRFEADEIQTSDNS